MYLPFEKWVALKKSSRCLHNVIKCSRVIVESNAKVSKTSFVSIFRVGYRADHPRTFYNIHVLSLTDVFISWKVGSILHPTSSVYSPSSGLLPE
jgi:hypothetical protein